MLSRLFGRGRPADEPIDYETAKALARDADPAVRQALARRTDLRPEVLYYLAEDSASAVRREVAGNPAAPGQANLLLATDQDDEVRCELARKITRLLPDLSPQQASRLRELAIEALEMLARDQLPRVRAILSEELKHADSVPKPLIRRLAADVEAIVAAPILEYSPLLADEDLLELIAGGLAGGALAAIARRRQVSEPVADAIVATLDVPAVAALLANPSAQIREETLDAIIDHAAGVESWHQPLVLRAELSVRAMRRISQFVAASLFDILVERHQLPQPVVDELRRAVRRRLEEAAPGSEPVAHGELVAELQAAGGLDEERVLQALDENDRGFVVEALAALAGVTPAVVTKITEARSPKAMTALAWKAGLCMRTALRLQARLALIPPAGILYARNGVDYPLTAAEMDWQIAYFSN